MSAVAIRKGVVNYMATDVYGDSLGEGEGKRIDALLDCGHRVSFVVSIDELVTTDWEVDTRRRFVCEVCGEAERAAILDERPETD